MLEFLPEPPNGMETVFHDGEGVGAAYSENEIHDATERTFPLFGAWSAGHRATLLTRHEELELRRRPGRNSQDIMHMNAFDELFHAELHSTLPTNTAHLQQLQRNYRSSSTTVSAALDMQDAIMKLLKRMSILVGETCTDDIVDPSIAHAVMHNLPQNQRECERIDLEYDLKGPAHVADKLSWHCLERRSTPARQYTFNAEQLECIALFVSRLDDAFKTRSELGQQWTHPACGGMTIIMDG